MAAISVLKHHLVLGAMPATEQCLPAAHDTECSVADSFDYQSFLIVWKSFSVLFFVTTSFFSSWGDPSPCLSVFTSKLYVFAGSDLADKTSSLLN